MGTRVVSLISIGLCLAWVVRAKMDPLPKPTLSAVPSPVVPQGADVTLRCHGHLGSDRFQLWKDGELREERYASWQQVEFVLRTVDAWRDGRSYSCRSGQGPLWSELSEPLALVVTGILLKPSISASPASMISPGTTVTICCQISPHVPPQDYSFALLEAKTLEPLQRQSLARTWANFSLLSVRPEDAGSYSCIYYRKTAPHRGSLLSQTLKLTVLGQLPRPTFLAKPGLVMAPGANITLWCSRPKVLSLENVTFTLWKAGTQGSLKQQISADLWTSFLLPSVRPEDTGSYSCTYRENRVAARESETSDALELLVPGSLPKPSLSALPGLVLEPGMHVTLQCRQPPHMFLSGLTFTLLKAGTPQALQSQSPAGTSADFLLLSVTAQDAGSYSCVYHWRKAPYQVSEPSEVLEIWLTDALPKPSLSAWPTVVSAANVTLLCQGPSWISSFVLYKDRKEKILPSMDNNQDGATFFLTPMTVQDSGSYSCSYQLLTNGNVWVQYSDPLQLMVTGTVPSNPLIITLSCVSFLLLLLCLLLLAIICQGSIPMGSLQGERPWRCLCCPCFLWNICLPHQSEAPREETLFSEVAKEGPRAARIPMDKDPHGVTYAQLNIRTLTERKPNHVKTSREPTIYSTVPRD